VPLVPVGLRGRVERASLLPRYILATRDKQRSFILVRTFCARPWRSRIASSYAYLGRLPSPLQRYTIIIAINIDISIIVFTK